MGISQTEQKNHEAINTIIMTIKKRICHKERLICHDKKTIGNLVENRIKTEKYIEKKNGKTISKWESGEVIGHSDNPAHKPTPPQQ